MNLPSRIVLDGEKGLITAPSDIRLKLDHYRILSRSGLSKLSAVDFDDLRKDAVQFFNFIPEFKSDTYPLRIFRVSFNQRINGAPRQQLTKISELIGPPVERATRLGRASLPGQSVFYGALDPVTALWETQPQKGDYISLSEWSIRPGKQLNVHYVFHPGRPMLNVESKDALEKHLTMQEQLHPIHREVITDLFSFYTEEFMKPVAQGSEADYLFSALCSSNCIRPPRPSEGPRVTDGIVYPSVKRALGVSNVAIANDVVLDLLQPIALTIYDVGETYYDTTEPSSGDAPIGVGPAQIRVTDFDEANDAIINPDSKEEMRILINAHMKSKGQSGTVTFHDGSQEVLGIDSDQPESSEKS